MCHVFPQSHPEIDIAATPTTTTPTTPTTPLGTTPPSLDSKPYTEYFDSDTRRPRKAYMMSGALIIGFGGQLSLALYHCLGAHFKVSRKNIC